MFFKTKNFKLVFLSILLLCSISIFTRKLNKKNKISPLENALIDGNVDLALNELFKLNIQGDDYSSFLNTTFKAIDAKKDLITKNINDFFFKFHFNLGKFEESMIAQLKLMILAKVHLIYKDVQGSKTNIDKISQFLPPNTIRNNIFEKMRDFMELPRDDVKIKKVLAFPIYHYDLSFYVNYSKFPKVELNNLQSNPVQFKEFNFAPFHDKVIRKLQHCGSCLSYATAAVMTHYYIKKNQNVKVAPNDPNIYNHLREGFFIEPFQLLACTNNKERVEESKGEPNDIPNDFLDKFPKSGGYYQGRGCMGGISPETLYWAQHNTHLIKPFTKTLMKNANILQLLNEESVNTGTLCADLSNMQEKLEPAFPKFQIKYVEKNLVFTNKTVKGIATTIMHLVNQYGYLLASSYGIYDGRKCEVLDTERESKIVDHYVAIVGVSYKKAEAGHSEEYSVITQDSDNENKEYDYVLISEGFIECNLMNNIWVME